MTTEKQRREEARKAHELDQEIAYQNAKCAYLYGEVRRRAMRKAISRLSYLDALRSTISYIGLSAIEIYNYNRSPMGRVSVIARQRTSKALKLSRFVYAINNGKIKPETPNILKPYIGIVLPDGDDVAQYG